MDTERRWFDYRILWRGDHWHIVLPIGPLAIGHLMLVSNEHKPSYAQTSPAARAEVEALLTFLVNASEQATGRPALVFEHGSGSGSSTGCIDHAHMQIVPGMGGLAAELIKSSTTIAGTLPELARLYPSGGYIMVSASGMIRAARDAGMPSQFFRRRVRRLQGLEDEWDYLMHKKEDDMRRTLEYVTSNKVLPTSWPLSRGSSVIF